jgi:hypothetical protein
VRSVRFAAADPRYAAVTLDGYGTDGAPVGEATAVLRRDRAGWRVLTLGSDDLGCGIPSATVRDQLGVGCTDG